MNAVMPSASPGEPELRAKMRSWLARCMPELKRLTPSITHPSPSRRAGASAVLGARHATCGEVGARVLAPVIEEAGVVVGLFERPDVGGYERVDLLEQVHDLGGQLLTHRLSFAFCAPPPSR